MALSYADNPQVQKNRWRILTAVGLFTFMATLDVFIAGMHDAFMVALVICLIATALTGWRMLKHRRMVVKN
ncbi:hypothetical protein ACEN4E_03475 [Latilactobacillus sakei]|uniref:hypothetical protein n=1 Tax=Latilactobacillus sakei TaxID=1599 RepID=UPI003886E6FF